MTQDLSAAKRALIQQRLRRRTAKAVITPREPGVAPPLSHAQERLWFLEQYRPGTTAYTVPFSVWLEGELTTEALREALAEVTARHETLRTRFTTSDDGLPELVIDDEPSVDLTVLRGRQRRGGPAAHLRRGGQAVRPGHRAPPAGHAGPARPRPARPPARRPPHRHRRLVGRRAARRHPQPDRRTGPRPAPGPVRRLRPLAARQGRPGRPRLLARPARARAAARPADRPAPAAGAERQGGRARLPGSTGTSWPR